MNPRTRAYWACQGIGWGLYVIVTVAQAYATEKGGARFIVEPLLAAALGIALTHAYRAYARKNGWLSLGAFGLVVRVFAGAVALSVVFIALLSTVEFGVYRDHPKSYVLVVISAVFRWTLVYLVWSGLYFSLGAARRRQELEKERQTAELRALEAQLNPHFLFNALNSIRALIAEEPTRAQDAVTELSRMLRYTLRRGEEDLVTLDRELETVDDYLALEALRLDTRLVVEREITEAARAARIPIMLLLTLVDNAIKHGIAQIPAGGTLRLAARVEGKDLVLDVTQPRPENPRADGRGIGLANVRARLTLLYGDRAAFELTLREREAHAHVRLPA